MPKGADRSCVEASSSHAPQYLEKRRSMQFVRLVVPRDVCKGDSGPNTEAGGPGVGARADTLDTCRFAAAWRYWEHHICL